MKKKILFTFSLLIFFLATPVFASENFFENSLFSITPAGGNFASQTQSTLSPKNGEKIFYSFHTQNIGNARATNEATRIQIPRSRNLYIWSDTKDVQIEKFSYEIESPLENNFFRIAEINSHPEKNFLPTIQVENASKFSFSLKGWKITQGEGEEKIIFDLPDEEMESGEKREFIFPLIQEGGKILLISPNKRIKDRILYPKLKIGESYKRLQSKSKKDARPGFFIAKNLD